MRPSVADAAASDTASPPNVLEMKVVVAICSMTSARPTTAASGYPLAIALPKAARSGVTPKFPEPLRAPGGSR